MLPLEQRIERDFEETKLRYPRWADALIFSHTIRGKGLKFESLKKLFEKLVDKKDYSQEDKDEILQDYYRKGLEGFE
jgi:hypothetical protein